LQLKLKNESFYFAQSKYLIKIDDLSIKHINISQCFFKFNILIYQIFSKYFFSFDICKIFAQCLTHLTKHILINEITTVTADQ
uniref:Ovule protein n=1 Tax=Brugia timori TaxID=42155 RepID=A0A0R3QQN5_9BILA